MRPKAWLWLLLVPLLAALGARRLARGEAIQTDLLAMLPATEQSETAERALRSLAQAGGERAVILAGAPDPAKARLASLQTYVVRPTANGPVGVGSVVSLL